MSFQDILKSKSELLVEASRYNGSFSLVEEYQNDIIKHNQQNPMRNHRVSFSCYKSPMTHKSRTPSVVTSSANDEAIKYNNPVSPRSSVCHSTTTSAINNTSTSNYQARERFIANDQASSVHVKNDLGSFDQDQDEVNYKLMKWFESDKDEMDLVCGVKDARINYLMKCNDNLMEEMRKLRAFKMQALETISVLQKETSKKEGLKEKLIKFWISLKNSEEKNEKEKKDKKKLSGIERAFSFISIKPRQNT